MRDVTDSSDQRTVIVPSSSSTRSSLSQLLDPKTNVIVYFSVISTKSCICISALYLYQTTEGSRGRRKGYGKKRGTQDADLLSGSLSRVISKRMISSSGMTGLVEGAALLLSPEKRGEGEEGFN